MPAWMVRCFHSVHGSDLFCKDYEKQTVKAKAEFRSTLSSLLAQPDIEGWRRPEFDRLKGRYHKLGKLRFSANNVKHRPLGFFLPGERVFVLLIWATERDWKFDPPDVRDTAMERMTAVLADPERATDCDL